MGDIKSKKLKVKSQNFLTIKRTSTQYRPVCERVRDYKEVSVLRSDNLTTEQSSRCMDCGTDFCNWGCPIGNYIPEWNDMVHNGQWEKAYELLEATNPLPEVTGRICPALCEAACVLGVNDAPVTIRENELGIIEYVWKHGLIKPRPPLARSGRTVAVIGSGPSGLSCASALNRKGYTVTVFEKDDKIGGILRYGIPDFKLDKSVLDRRINLWKEEGIKFMTGQKAGKEIKKDFDAVVFAGGSRDPRDLAIPGRDRAGIHFAMEYLTQANRRVIGEKFPADRLIDAKGKRVVVIGGGDTGSDCVGTAHRQGAACVVQIEIMPQPQIVKTTSSHEEGGERRWSVLTKEFDGTKGRVEKLKCARVDSPDKVFEIRADLVLLALGFLRDDNLKTDDNFMTSDPGIFCCGDQRRGQSLVVHAISEGLAAAKKVDKWIMR